MDYLLESLLESDPSSNDANDFKLYLPEAITFMLNAQVDLNLASIITPGGLNLGGITKSDIYLDISFGDPINSPFISLYYLGSSGLGGSAGSSANTNRPVGVNNGSSNTIFNDAVYIDLTSFGLGKIKLSGLVGLLGGNSGTGNTGEGTTASAGEAEAVADGGLDMSAVTGELIIEESRLGINLNSAFFERIFDLLGLNFTFGNPPIQDASLILDFDNGLNGASLEVALDSVGTSIGLNISDIDVMFSGDSLIDVESKVNEVAYGYAGLDLGTLGVGGVVAQILDSMDPSLTVTYNKRTYDSKVVTNVNLFGGWGVGGKNDKDINDGLGANIYYGASSVTINLLKEKKAIDGSAAIDRIKLDISAYHPLRQSGNADGVNGPFEGIDGWLYNGNLVLTGVGSVFDSSLNAIINSIFEPLDLASYVGENGQIFDIVEMMKGDNDYYNYPKTGAFGEVYSTNDVDDGTSEYTWSPDLGNLISGIDIQMFGTDKVAWTPYGNKFTESVDSERYSTVSITFDKNTFNDLLVYVYYFLISAFNSDALVARMKEANGGSYSNVSGLLRAVENATTSAQRVNIMKPYAYALPSALVQWLITDQGGFGANVLAAGAWVIKSLSLLIDTLLPIPFASSSVTAKLYIDSKTTSTQDGGIKSIELYIDANRATTGGNTSNTTNFLQLVIQPTESDGNLIGLSEVETVTIPKGQATVPSRAEIMDIANRSVQITVGSSKKTISLTHEYLTNPTYFPQRASVTFSDGFSDN